MVSPVDSRTVLASRRIAATATPKRASIPAPA
jgi:hypothetical protein